MVTSYNDSNEKTVQCVEEILRKCARKYLPNVKEKSVNCLFSQDIGFTYIDMLYVFLRLESDLGISLKLVDWENEDLFTFSGLCALVSNQCERETQLLKDAQ